MSMTKSDRQQLQSLVRRRFRNLKRQIEQRRNELLADMESQLAAQYADEDKAWAAARRHARAVVADCNQRVNEIWAEVVGDGYEEMDWVTMHGVPAQVGAPERMQLRRAAMARIDEQVQDAQLELDQRETELLERLLVDGLETEAAREFLGQVPSVAQLVPASRLAQLESGFTWQAADDG